MNWIVHLSENIIMNMYARISLDGRSTLTMSRCMNISVRVMSFKVKQKNECAFANINISMSFSVHPSENVRV